MMISRPLALGLLALTALPSQALTIADDFKTGTASVTFNGANGIKTGGAVNLGNGLSRTLGTEILSNEDPGDARARSAVTAGGYSFSTDAEVWGDGRLDYAFSPSSLGDGVFELDFLSNDMAGVGGLTLTDAAGRSALLMFALPAHARAFSLLTPSFSTSGVDLSRVVEADFMLNPGQGGDLMLSGLEAVHAQTVPEPTCFAALGIGALGFLRRRRV